MPRQYPDCENIFVEKFPKFKVNMETGEMTWEYQVKHPSNPGIPPLAAIQRIINHLMDGKNGQVSHSSVSRSEYNPETYSWTITIQ